MQVPACAGSSSFAAGPAETNEVVDTSSRLAELPNDVFAPENAASRDWFFCFLSFFCFLRPKRPKNPVLRDSVASFSIFDELNAFLNATQSLSEKEPIDKAQQTKMFGAASVALQARLSHPLPPSHPFRATSKRKKIVTDRTNQKR
jgi:hypothetical protein